MKNKIICLLDLATLSFTSCKKEVTTTPSTTVATKTPTVQTTSQAITETATPVAEGKQTTISFTEEEFDFGDINQGDKVVHVFTFKNTGENDLTITKAVGSCGCTVPEFPKEPIAPGKSGTLKATFNSDGKSGPQNKSITVSANVPNGAAVIRIKANIKVANQIK